jgi:hypothetical protein
VAIVPLSCPTITTTLTVDTTWGSSLITTYTDGTALYLNETGPEILYVFTTTQTTHIYATIHDWLPDGPGDPDLFLLSAPSGSALMPGGYGDTSLVATNVLPGRYYLSTDGWLGWAGSYSLDLACIPAPSSPVPHEPSLWLPILLRSSGGP